MNATIDPAATPRPPAETGEPDAQPWRPPPPAVREVVLTSNPVHAAGGLRMMARHLLDTIDPWTAHPDRLAETADHVQALLCDAIHLVGDDQHDRRLWRRIGRLRTLSERLAAVRS